ncbi:uncharacterized protein EAE98_000696 [Botrytis deweyae]|uniref:Uncharacterized protein n=1 Tax=Botrytis deweyae TaxID=2478750 RepID=A0ABQ7J3E5_9HELO|nr:uncharacterized protein EAE98_000696 [Botrytis deweyae]KAF7940569.1 hypothetical protein EAE98_000696 [Botrytis deweyae]
MRQFVKKSIRKVKQKIKRRDQDPTPPQEQSTSSEQTGEMATEQQQSTISEQTDEVTTEQQQSRIPEQTDEVTTEQQQSLIPEEPPGMTLEEHLRALHVHQNVEHVDEPHDEDLVRFQRQLPRPDPFKPPISSFFRNESYIFDAKNCETESGTLAEETFQYFYCKEKHQFQGKVEHESTLGKENDFAYVLWPVSIMLHAAADCLSHSRINQVEKVQQEYWNKDYHAFCAWKMFLGNKDIYYDDNAHVVQALVSSYEVTGQLEFLLQAKDVLECFIMPFAEKESGGIAWHLSDKTVRAACSVGPAAVSALRIRALPSTHVIETRDKAESYLMFATILLTWLQENLQDPKDKLIWDQLKIKEDGSTEIERTKWSYNSGFAIHGFTLLYEATNDLRYLSTAIEIAEAAMDPEGALFDHCNPNLSQRMLSDGSFFLHHLVDGYLALSKHAHTKKLRNEIVRIAKWGKEFMRDREDSLYYRGSRPYTISPKHARQFYKKFGVGKTGEQNMQERDKDGNLCKTMIGCASWARIIHAAEIVEASIAKDSEDERANEGMRETTDAMQI